MNKKLIFLLVNLIVILIFSQNLVHAISSDSANDWEWRGFGKYLNNTRYSRFNVIENISLANIRNISRTSISGSQNPIIANGYVYVGGLAVMRQFNATNVSQEIANITLTGGSNPNIYTIPAVAGDYLYAGLAVTGWGYIYGLNATNISQQLFNSDSSLDWPYDTGLSVYNDYIYSSNGVIAYNYYYVNRINATNLSSITSYSETFSTLGGWTGTPAVVDDKVYVTNGGTANNNKVFALNVSNISQIVAAYNPGLGIGIDYSSAAVSNGYVYFGTSSGSDYKFYQLNSSTKKF